MGPSDHQATPPPAVSRCDSDVQQSVVTSPSTHTTLIVLDTDLLLMVSVFRQYFHMVSQEVFQLYSRGRILVQVTIYRRLLIGRDRHLDQSESTIYRNLYENTGPVQINQSSVKGIPCRHKGNNIYYLTPTTTRQIYPDEYDLVSKAGNVSHTITYMLYLLHERFEIPSHVTETWDQI